MHAAVGGRDSLHGCVSLGRGAVASVSLPWGTQAPQLEAGRQVRFPLGMLFFGEARFMSPFKETLKAMGEKKTNLRGVGELGVTF